MKKDISEPQLKNNGQPDDDNTVIMKTTVPSLKKLSENMHVKKLEQQQQQKHFTQTKTVDNNRPIFPNCPFSPYNSPTNSPRSNRKRQPLKESRRVSIEKSGMYLQLNQYKLMDSIGQVRWKNCWKNT